MGYLGNKNSAKKRRAKERRRRNIVGSAITLVAGVLALLSLMAVVMHENGGDDILSIFGYFSPEVSTADVVSSDSQIPPEVIEPEIDRVDEILLSMTTEEKVGAMLLPRRNNLTQEEFLKLLSDVHAGGTVLFRADFADKNREETIAYTSAIQATGGGNMLLCVDEEGGTVVRLSSNSLLRESKYLSPQNVYSNGGMQAIIDDTVDKCRFLSDLGLNVNLAPVADVVTDKKGVLYKRAFGADAESTAEFVSTVVGVMNKENVGCCLKHFPGYGNSHGDTHQGLVESAITAETLWQSDLVPFIRGIEAGADAVMVTHTIVTCIDPELPCSISPKAVSLLRDELGFEGVIITDGLDMGAIAESCDENDPCVQAVMAGCDLMCTPADAVASYNALLDAVNDGSIPMEQLDASVRRIINWKLKLGMYKEDE